MVDQLVSWMWLRRTSCPDRMIVLDSPRVLMVHLRQVPSHFLPYSFALKPDWSRRFARRSEIHQYFTNIAAQYDIHKHVRLASLVEKASWDGITGMWNITVRDLRTSEVTEYRKDLDIRGRDTLCPQGMHHSRCFKLSWEDIPHGTVGPHIQLERQGACCRR